MPIDSNIAQGFFVNFFFWEIKSGARKSWFIHSNGGRNPGKKLREGFPGDIVIYGNEKKKSHP